MNKRAQFSSIRWSGGSVSGLVVIAGLIVYFIGDKSLGTMLMILGLAAAFFMSPVGRSVLRV